MVSIVLIRRLLTSPCTSSTSKSAAQIDIEVKEDRQGALWIGTHSSGLQRLDPATGGLRLFTSTTQMTNESEQQPSKLRALRSLRDDVGWHSDGLAKFDPRTATFKTYYEQDGLSGNAVSCILEDQRGSLWMSTNNGLSVFDPAKQTFKSYSAADGLPALT